MKNLCLLFIIFFQLSCFNINPQVTSTGGSSPSNPLLSRKRVFTTSGLYRPVVDFIGLTAADSICQSVATTASLGGTWKAWLSTSGSAANTRISNVSPWYKVDRSTLVFAGYPSALNLNLVALDTDQNGNTIANPNVWTQSFSDGTIASPSTYDCTNWTISSPGFYANVGSAVQVGSGWTFWGNLGCDNVPGAHLYCFEQ